MRHSVWRSARRMCWRSASSSVEIEEVRELEDVKEDPDSVPAAELSSRFASSVVFSSLSGTRSSFPGERSTARSMKFSSSRMLPGQE